MKVRSWDRAQLPSGHSSVFGIVGVVLVVVSVFAALFSFFAFDADYAPAGWVLFGLTVGGASLGLALILCGGIINEIRRNSLESAIRHDDPRVNVD